MSDQNDKPVEGDEVVAHLDGQDVATSDDTNAAKPQEAIVQESTVTITVSKRMARIGALLLAGFVGFIIGVVGIGAAHHLHDGRDGRGPGHMRMDDFDRQGGQGQFGPGPGMMPGGQGFGPDDQRGPGMMPGGQGHGFSSGNQDGPGMMPGGPGQGLTPTPLATSN